MESISVFDIFKIGVGPSSSHTMGPWRAAQQFVGLLDGRGELDGVASVRVDLFGSLAKTGKGHGTDVAVLMGLVGEDPVTCETSEIHPKVAAIRSGRRLVLGGRREVPFDYKAITASDIALSSDPRNAKVTLDAVIRLMWATAQDMNTK